MRLIDAEEFKDDIFRQIELIKVNDFEVCPVVDVNECLDNAPTVEAIPKEWIRNYVSIWISEPYKNFVLNMIAIWEKENGTI